eukprot:CAMPEP_0113892748 /NCGR_PEP_ID=MMETSP0780_2-20120614/15624_1 /TAXON_ID=652834 /ORGANISM="Palpitomonas bilix" /LENGTH=213 /DNA_ID=CAMNT_0000882791 /DNA_START=127 /DNA_END=765 /DNA_ORIENTATION=- /assembly_acc=CAM_ASM_000599
MKRSFGDLYLSDDDIAALQSPTSWWTDGALALALMLVQEEEEKEDGQWAGKLAVCPPSLSLLLSSVSGDFSSFRALALDFGTPIKEKSELYAFPLSDGDGITTLSGQHWAVLLLQKDGQFAVIDSLANSAFLKKGALLARAFASAMSFPSSPQLAFSPKDLPQLQLNSYDCGPTVAAVVAEFVSIPPSEDTLKKGFALVSKESHTFQRKAQKW